jgi:hypothetical protein
MSASSWEPGQDKAIRLLKEQLKELESIRGLRAGASAPEFSAWRDTTTSLLKRFLAPDSPHLETFTSTHFLTLSMYPKPGEDQRSFSDGCKTAEAMLRAVIKEIENFGVHIGQARTKAPDERSGRDYGGVHQTFHGPVTIQTQAIATDNAIQRISHAGDMGDFGASLKEIADLFQRSEELKGREVKEGLARIEALAVEVQKPEEKRNWKSVLDCGQAVLSIADKATDLAHKLAPYTPAVVALMEKAKHILG